MVRTMLFAFASLVGVGTMVAMEIGTPPRAAVRAAEPLITSTVGIGASHDTLTKADRLEITYLRNDVPIQPVIPDPSISPAPPIPVHSQPVPKTDRRHERDPNARKLAVALPRPRPKPKHVSKNVTKHVSKDIAKKTAQNKTKTATGSTANDAKRATHADRSKLTVEVKPCQPNALGNFLKVLNLPSGCQT
jgi:hypothetical protein